MGGEILAGVGVEQFLLFAILPVGALVLILTLLVSDDPKANFLRRIKRIKTTHQSQTNTPGQILIARHNKRMREMRGFDKMVRRYLPRQQVLRDRIDRAGLGFSVGTYVLANFFTGGVCLALIGTLANLPIPATVLFALTLGAAIPHQFLSMRIKSRQKKFIEFLPDAIDLMVRGVKAGLPVAESIKTAGEEIAAPVGTEFTRITDAVRIGRRLTDVLWDTSRRLKLQEFDFLTIALSIQSETGGNLAETLDNLSEVLRGRRHLKRKVKALSSEAKASAYIIGSLPFIMTLLIYLVNQDYILGLFRDPRGQLMVGVGLAMIFVGGAVMNSMIKFKI